MSSETISNVQVPLKKRTKSRNGCIRCKDKRRKCDETQPECKECIRRNLPCPGYKKEIKWSLRHEKMLRREQPKSCVRRAKSPEKALFHEATEAIQQDTEAEASLPTVNAGSSIIEIPRHESGASSAIDEDALRDFLLRSDQAFENASPWLQPDPLSMLHSITHPIADDVPQDVFDLPEVEGPVVVDLDGLDVSEGQTQYPDWSLQRRHEDENDIQEDEQAVVRKSLSTWRKNVSSEPRSMIDVTTFLIDHWFREVCPQWSAFDSNLNPNRVHMSQIWTNSKAVLHSMKTMAATCLMSTLPHLKQEAIDSARISVQAIGEDLGALQLAKPHGKLTVPIELCLALLCVGTTMCWLDTNLLGLAYWKEARRLRDFFNDNYWLLDEEEQQKLAFFENSCVYWDMLCSVVSNESADTPLSEDAIIGCSPPASLIKPHPWTGVAYKQQRLLSRTIALCRRHRLRMRKAKAESPHDSLPQPEAEDLMDAYLLSNELENMDLPAPHAVLDMGDRLSKPSHFSQLAIAFRIASLLQLHQTFQLDIGAYHTSNEDRTSSQKRLVLKLALELCALLEDIPVTSNTRCTQPILYITAASGLRFDTPPSKNDPFSLTPEVLEVHRARSFILDRFASLQRSLPPNPIVVATKLVQAVWREYEDDGEGGMATHWIDVMIDGRLSTLFG